MFLFWFSILFFSCFCCYMVHYAIRDNFDWMVEFTVKSSHRRRHHQLSHIYSFVTFYNLFVNAWCICIVAKLLAHHLTQKNVHLRILNNCWKHFSIDFCLFAFRFTFSDSNKMNEQWNIRWQYNNYKVQCGSLAWVLFLGKRTHSHAHAHTNTNKWMLGGRLINGFVSTRPERMSEKTAVLCCAVLNVNGIIILLNDSLYFCFYLSAEPKNKIQKHSNYVFLFKKRLTWCK